MDANRDVRSITPDEFRAMLEDARRRAAGVKKLSEVLSVPGRTISRWLAGDGPARATMLGIALTLSQIKWGDE
jgi:hypothetical protein